MKNLKKILVKYGFIFIFLLLIPSFNRLIHKGFFPTQDYIYVARIYQMDKSLKDGQFPVRWVPDFRYGEPLFNFYAPLPYYAGSFVHTFDISFLDTAKVLYAIGFVLSFVSMYFLGKELWGKTGGLISAFVYLYAPYRALDVYVRGDLSESWVFIFFPLIFLGALKLSNKVNGKNIAFLALSLAGLFYTHNVMTMLIAPFFVLWTAFLVWRKKNTKLLYPLVFASVLGVGLAASFLLPAFFEKSFIQTAHLTDGYFDFRAHFVETRQFFSTFWGYGASTWLGDDGMSFQLGTLQWITVGITSILLIIKRKKAKKDGNLYLLIFLLALFLASLFLQHNKSTLIWINVPLLQYVQFPWRFMAISTFLAAVVSGALVYFLPKAKYFIFTALVISLISVNYNYFRFESYYDDSVDAHYISAETLSKDDRLPKDYLPVWVKVRKNEKLTLPTPKSGKAKVANYSAKSDSAVFDLFVEEDAMIQVPITYFPGWTVKLNGQKVKLEEPSELGLIKFAAPVGEYKVHVYFGNTFLRTLGNAISLVSIFLIVYLMFIFKNKHVKQRISKK